MDNTDWLDYKIQVRDRLRIFTLKILELSEMFPNTQRGRIINNQLTKSGSSTYANYRAALRGRSKAEFFAKLSISVEEADETEMWIDLVVSSGIIKNSRFNAKKIIKMNPIISNQFSNSHNQSYQSFFYLFNLK